MDDRAQDAKARIPITVLTGFLGAGKTTLLNRILESRPAGQYAVIVNEYGDIGLDVDLIEPVLFDGRDERESTNCGLRLRRSAGGEKFECHGHGRRQSTADDGRPWPGLESATEILDQAHAVDLKGDVVEDQGQDIGTWFHGITHAAFVRRPGSGTLRR